MRKTPHHAVQDMELTVHEVQRVREEIRTRGFAVCRQLLSEHAVQRARAHLEAAVEKHLQAAVESGKLTDAFPGLALEDRMAAAYRECPEEAPCSWVPQTRTSFAFQQLLFRDAALCSLVTQLTGGRPAEVASRYNCRCKLPGTSGASFPWHQDHAFFRMQYLLKKQAPKRLLAAWAPLVSVDATNGGVELSPTSHLLGYVKHQRQGGFMTVANQACEPGGDAAVALATACPPHDRSRHGGEAQVPTELPTLHPGDVLLFTDLTLHRSGPNVARTARWSADWAYELFDEDPITPSLEPQVAMSHRSRSAFSTRATPSATCNGVDTATNNEVCEGAKATTVVDKNRGPISSNAVNPGHGHGGREKLALVVAFGAVLLFALGGAARLSIRGGRS